MEYRFNQGDSVCFIDGTNIYSERTGTIIGFHSGKIFYVLKKGKKW